MTYETILVDIEGHVGVLRLNRPEARNALNSQVMTEMAAALADFDADPAVGAVVITGDDKAFAAGADIKEMSEAVWPQTFISDFLDGDWLAPTRARKPLIAAVSGYALGGGCELALSCDIILAAPNAKFGLPEITLGVIPGIGGTQRLPRAVGKAKAMEMILTGRFIDAEEAERCGLVSRVTSENVVEDAIRAGEKIAGFSALAVRMGKEMIDRAYESTLAEGVLTERRGFQALFASEDQKEGMAAFIEKRKPDFKDR